MFNAIAIALSEASIVPVFEVSLIFNVALKVGD